MAASPHDALVLTGAAVAAATGGAVLSGADRRLSSFSIDSRTLAAGDFFIALHGDRFDGAAFARDALARGAGGAMVNEAGGLAAGLAADFPACAIVRVADTTSALQALGRDVRRRSGARVVAITGSAGKTTTKETIAELLAARYRVFRNAGNLNNHIGLPFSLLHLVSRPDVAVVELGMNHAGEIRLLVAIAEPDVRVWTNVGDAHMGFFESADAIADAKGEILEGASNAALLVANADDDRVMTRARRFAGRVVSFGTSPSATVRASDIQDRGIAGTRAAVHTPAGDTHVAVPLIGRGNLMNVLAAIAVAIEFEVPIDAIPARVSTLRPAAHRGEVIALGGGVTLVDDSYNSSPAALMRALEAIGRDATHDRRVAILGEMLELGRFSTALHEECGRFAAASGIEALLTIGGDPARRLGAAAADAGLDRNAVRHADTSLEAASIAAGFLRPGDLVLVKGSRGIKTDIVVERLEAEWR